jgi:hypothetical protein
MMLSNPPARVCMDDTNVRTTGDAQKMGVYPQVLPVFGGHWTENQVVFVPVPDVAGEDNDGISERFSQSLQLSDSEAQLGASARDPLTLSSGTRGVLRTRSKVNE